MANGDVTVDLGNDYIGSAYSPVVDITETADGHTVSITSADPDHPGQLVTHTYDVPDWSGDEAERVAAEEARQAAETARAAAEQARAQAESARADAETGRTQAETARADAEQSRQQAETTRSESEQARADAEAARAAAETARAAAETARQQDTAAAISAAQTATGAANTAATAATGAATAANSAASAATAATGQAQTATAAANDAATAANTAAGSANTAAGTANIAAQAADEAREGIQGDLAEMKDSINNLGGYPPKNLFPDTWQSRTANGITWTANGDGTVTAQGVATANSYVQASATLPAGTYILNGGAAGGGSNTYHIMFTNPNGQIAYKTSESDTVPMTWDDEFTLTLYLRVMNGTDISNGITFKPMVRLASISDPTFMPYGEMYVEKSVKEIADDYATGTEFDAVTGVAYGVKNLLPNNLSSQTINGLAVTVNSDKSVTIVGTASAQTALMMKATLPVGAYKVTGAPAGSNAETYHMLFNDQVSGSVNFVTESNPNVSLNVNEASTVNIYIRVMNGKTIDATFYPMVRDATVYPFDTTYVPYGQKYVPKTLSDIAKALRSPWYGKKMNVIGDSIVQGSYGNFVVEIQKELWLSVARNYGVGGCCIASTDQDSQYPPVVSRWDDMDDDADIVIVHAGTNDYSAQVPLGDPTSTDITTFNGALNTIMDGLRDKYPSALVIFSGILHRYNDNGLTIKASEYREAMESRCLAKHFVYYDGYRWSGFDFVKGYYDHVLTNDGLHPNALGARILGRKLAGFINWQ